MPTYQEFLSTVNLETIKYNTVHRWMKYLAYNYEESKCCYYIDEHERDDIVKDRGNRFLYCCFLNKLRCHCWVHLSKQKAINIYNKDPSFLIHACHEFTRTIEDKISQFREYH